MSDHQADYPIAAMCRRHGCLGDRDIEDNWNGRASDNAVAIMVIRATIAPRIPLRAQSIQARR